MRRGRSNSRLAFRSRVTALPALGTNVIAEFDSFQSGQRMLSASHSLAFTFAMTMDIEHGAWVERGFRWAGYDGNALYPALHKTGDEERWVRSCR